YFGVAIVRWAVGKIFGERHAGCNGHAFLVCRRGTGFICMANNLPASYLRGGAFTFIFGIAVLGISQGAACFAHMPSFIFVGHGQVIDKPSGAAGASVGHSLLHLLG